MDAARADCHGSIRFARDRPRGSEDPVVQESVRCSGTLDNIDEVGGVGRVVRSERRMLLLIVRASCGRAGSSARCRWRLMGALCPRATLHNCRRRMVLLVFASLTDDAMSCRHCESSLRLLPFAFFFVLGLTFFRRIFSRTRRITRFPLLALRTVALLVLLVAAAPLLRLALALPTQRER